MMNHSARPSETRVVFEEPEIEISHHDHADIPPIRRHRPVTALVRRRSSKLAQLVQTVADDRGIDDDNDSDEEKWRMSGAAKRAASAPHRHRMSIRSFYADFPEYPASAEPEMLNLEEPVRDITTKRNSIKEHPDKPVIRPRSSFHRPSLKSTRPTLRPKTALIKKALPKRKDSIPAKNKKKDVDKDDGSGDDSDSDTGSDSSLSTLESLKELKNRIDEIVGTRPVYASRSVRRGSASHVMGLGQKKKEEAEKSEMTADAVMMRRRPAMISIDSMRSKSLINVKGGQERVTNSVPTRTRSASLAPDTNLLQPRSRSARALNNSRKRAQSVSGAADGQKSPAVQIFEDRRSSISTAFKDAKGNVSYRTRRNLRRGSLFAQSKSTSRGDDSDESRRGSLLVPDEKLLGHRDSFEGGYRRASSPGGSRRRSAKQEDIQLSVPDPITVKLARERFRRMARLVLNCVKICRRSYLNIEQGREEFQSFIQVGTRPDHHGDRLFFDPDYFKADKSQRLSEETKRILTQYPENRTDKELKYVQIALRNIKAFAEYPIRMQGRLCKVGWLETYGANRAVVRQGHPPHAFYFILSGTLIVTIFMTHGPKGKPATQTVAFLRRGQSFGELAILNETVRASTVITKSRCEMLVISDEDFQDIFMVSGGIKSVNDPDQQAFLTSLRFLTHWPIHILPQHPKECLFHFFATDDVLVQDSNQSKWIYIVKSGSCSVLKKLKRVPENLHPAYKRKDVTMAWNRDTTLVSSIIGDPTKSPSRKKVKVNVGGGNPSRDDAKSKTTNDRRSSESTSTRETSVKGHWSETSSIVPPVTRKSQGVYLKTGGSAEGEEGDSEGEEEELDENGLPVNFVDQRRTFHTDLDISKTMEHELTDADKHPTFVTIQLLLKGGVFGVNSLVFPDQPSLSLISNGAECILINKQFYLEHATEDTLSLLRKHEFPYPTEGQLQNMLQKHMNWNAYKDHTVKSVVFHSRAHRAGQLRAVNR